MKKKLLFLLKHLLLTVMLSGSIVAFGQTEVTYTFSDHYSNAVEIGSGSIEGNLDFLAEKNSSSTNPTYYTSGSAARFYYNSGGNGGSYTITAKNGVTITAIELYAVSSYTPAVKYNIDGGGDLNASLSGTTYSITGISAASSLKFRNANTTNTQLRITGFKVTYSSVVTPTITVSPSSLTTFSYVVDNGPSNNLTFTVSGSNLDDDILITQTSNFKVSLDGTNFTGNITLPETGGAVSNTTVYVRLKAGLPLGNYSQDITLTSTNADTKTVSCSGSVIPNLPDLIINEILADPDATNGDANGDGTVNTSDDEFVEIVNNDTYPVNLSGYTLSDGYGVRHTFSAITLNPNEAIVVFGGGTPTGFLTYAIVASTGQLGLNNTGDDVTLKDASGYVIDSYTYGSEAGNNQSITRVPDLDGTSTMVQHSTAPGSNGALFSPGNHIDGTSFTLPPEPVPFDWRYVLLSFMLIAGLTVYRKLR